MRETKLVAGLVMLAGLVLFTIQNVELLQVHFLVWTLEIRRAFLLFIVLAVGIVLVASRRYAVHDLRPRADRRPDLAGAA